MAPCCGVCQVSGTSKHHTAGVTPGPKLGAEGQGHPVSPTAQGARVLVSGRHNPGWSERDAGSGFRRGNQEQQPPGCPEGSCVTGRDGQHGQWWAGEGTRARPLRQVNVAGEGVQLDPGPGHPVGEEVMAAA